MRVQDLMTQMPATCTRDSSCAEAARIMWDCDCGSVPVVDQNGRAVGIVTDRDICMAALFHGSPLSSISIAEVMSGDLCTCHADDDVREAERLMKQRQVRRLPVIDDGGSLVGILSLGDVAQGVGANGKGVRPEGLDLVTTIAAISEPRTPHQHAHM
ncbi:MAG TPA: CBS domain-containing protein [Vicinamibacterales bacterium]|nr:CBS domain-containing protein [Vicinamibacterales bacterium]